MGDEIKAFDDKLNKRIELMKK